MIANIHRRNVIFLISTRLRKDLTIFAFQLKCPKVEISEETYGLELISGVQGQRLCGLQIHQGNASGHVPLCFKGDFTLI